MGFALFTTIELLIFLIGQAIDFKNKKQLNILAGLMFFIMFVFAGVRGSGDADYYNYLWFVKDLGVDYTSIIIPNEGVLTVVCLGTYASLHWSLYL